jgi:hypothetical protein
MLNDYVLIRELAGLPKPLRLMKLNALGDEAASYLEEQARQALSNWRHVLVLTGQAEYGRPELQRVFDLA